MLVPMDSEELIKLTRECAEAKDELRKIEETIYYDPNWGSPELQDRISLVEEALGFKLYCWQKTYIANGKFRRYGETTAKILKELLDIEGDPIDYRRPVGSFLERMYRDELLEIKEKLDVAGIKTRHVLLTNTDKHFKIKLNAKGMAETTQTYIKETLANDRNELESKEKIENFLIKALKTQFPNCYITCTYNMAYEGLNIRIEGFKNNKLCKLRRMFAMEILSNAINAESSVTYILNVLANEWMDQIPKEKTYCFL